MRRLRSIAFASNAAPAVAMGVAMLSLSHGSFATDDDPDDLSAIIHIPCRYELTEIEGPTSSPLTTSTHGMAINELGHVVGYYAPGSNDATEAFIWKPETGLVKLVRPPGTTGATGLGMNNLGQVVGQITTISEGWRGYIWTDGQWVIIPPADNPSSWSRTYAINDSGVAVGYRGTPGGTWAPWNAFRYEDGVISDMGLIDGLPNQALAINESGQIVGHTAQYTFLPEARAFLWDGDEVTIFGPVPGGFSSAAYAINDAGALGGGGQVSSPGAPFGLNRGLVLDPTRRRVETAVYQPLPGLLLAWVGGLNNAGAAVGTSWSVPGNPNVTKGVLFIGSSTLSLSSFLGPRSLPYDFRWTNAINNSWQITGDAKPPGGGATIAYRLDPVWTVPADLNCDGIVGPEDLATVLADWGMLSSRADLNRNGVVDATDLGLLLAEWD